MTAIAQSDRMVRTTVRIALVVIVFVAALLPFSKSRNRIRSDEFINWTDQEILHAYDTTTNSVLKEKLRKEQKARGLRNQRKQR
ncbi:hypothetical protein [Rhodoflexus caldus]|uniref:hypothetical protein n=1 Tax=Rhodoflexus caldus TaxID=2891236 RepID=UPI00202A40F5|nr:hypothetical protein [Rhodoflexus caldus]